MSHAAFIAAAYGAAAVILVLMTAWIVFDYRALRRALTRFEETGVTRRSERSVPPLSAKPSP